MKTQVTFETDFFKPEPGEDQHTNPGCFGRALAVWLQAQLATRGVPSEAIIAEDFGWVIMVSRQPFLLWLACANTEDSITEWRIFPVAELSLRQRLFSKPDTKTETDKLWEHVKAVVPEIPDVHNMIWD